MSALPSPAQIVAAQTEGYHFGATHGFGQRELAWHRQIYATKLAQSDSLSRAFDEGNVEIVVRSETQHLVVRLEKETASEVYMPLRDALDEQLRTLEAKIVRLHLQLEQVAMESAQPSMAGQDYAPAILALCMPARTSPV